MQAITITYKGPTNHKSAHFLAKCAAGQLKVPYDHSLDTASNIKAAVKALLVHLGWIKSAGYAQNWIIGQTWQGPYVAVYTGLASAVFMDGDDWP